MRQRDARKNTREALMQLLYEMDLQKDASARRKEQFWERQQILRDYRVEGEGKVTPLDKSYFDEMYRLYLQHLEEIDGLLSAASDNWKLSRISKVDLAILRLSVAEIWYNNEIPQSVSVNEAIDLAKKFGGEDSGKFVNGILGKVIRSQDEVAK